MKKLLLLSSALIALRLTSMAQTSLELIPSAGYTFPDQVNFADHYGRIEAAVHYGGSLMFNASRNFGIELMYQRSEASSGLYDYGDVSHVPFEKSNVVINYIMAGPVSSITAGPVRPFIGVLLGAAVFNPGPVDLSSNTKFAWGAQAGMNLYVSNRVGIRIKAQMLSPVQGSGGGFYFGNFGSAAVYSTYSSSYIYQFGFSAGLIFGIGNIIPPKKPRVIIHRPPPAHHYYYYGP